MHFALRHDADDELLGEHHVAVHGLSRHRCDLLAGEFHEAVALAARAPLVPGQPDAGHLAELPEEACSTVQ